MRRLPLAVSAPFAYRRSASLPTLDAAPSLNTPLQGDSMRRAMAAALCSAACVAPMTTRFTPLRRCSTSVPIPPPLVVDGPVKWMDTITNEVWNKKESQGKGYSLREFLVCLS